MLDQGCPIEFFRVQMSPFYFLAHIFLSIRGCECFLTHYIIFINKFKRDL
jgi:hypothetical protein